MHNWYDKYNATYDKANHTNKVLVTQQLYIIIETQRKLILMQVDFLVIDGKKVKRKIIKCR